METHLLLRFPVWAQSRHGLADGNAERQEDEAAESSMQHF